MLNKFLKSRINTAKKLVSSLNKEYEYVSILGSVVNNKVVRVSTHVNSIDEVERECGFVIKLYKDGRYSEYSCNDIANLKPQDVIKSVKLKNVVTDDFKVKMLQEKPNVHNYLREDKDTLKELEIVNMLTAIKDRLEKRDKRAINIITQYVKRETNKIFVSNKKVLTQKYDWVNVMLLCVVRDGEVIKNNYEVTGFTDSLKTIKSLDKIANKALDVALMLLEAKSIKPGKYTIITDPGVSGLIAHEAFGHGVEMDMFVKNRAKAKDYVGKYVASKIVNMFDGASSCISSASFFFDDDGVEAHNTQIIKDGVLVSGISDSLSAMMLSTKPTGNGRRESYQRKVYTRMTNTFFASGKDKVEDMIKSVKHGYLLCQANNGMEDPKNWQIQCTASYGIEIKNGKLTKNIVAPVIITGHVVDLLSSISMVSNKTIVSGSGMCGKGNKEWVYVSDGGPYLKAEAILG